MKYKFNEKPLLMWCSCFTIIISILSCQKAKDDKSLNKVETLIYDTTSRWVVESRIIVTGNNVEHKEAEFHGRELRFLKYVYTYRLDLGVDEPLVIPYSLSADSIRFESECNNTPLCTVQAKLLNGRWRVQFINSSELKFTKSDNAVSHTMVWKRK